MKKLLLTLALSYLTLISAKTAYADYGMDGWYLSGSGAFSWHNDITTGDVPGELLDLKLGYGANAAIGYLIEEWRLEFEGVYRFYKNDTLSVSSVTTDDRGKLQNIAVLLNLLYELPLSDVISIYGGAGIGISYIRLKLNSPELSIQIADHDTVLAWQILSGVAFNITDCLAVTVGYRLFENSKPTLKTKSITSSSQKFNNVPYSNNLDLGMRFRF